MIRWIKDTLEFFFLVWIPGIAIVFLIALFAMLGLTGKFNKEEALVTENQLDEFVEEYYENDDRNVWFIRKNYINNRPYHYTINFYDSDIEYIRLVLDEEEIKIETVEFENEEDD